MGIDAQPNPFTTAVPISIQDATNVIVDVFMCQRILAVTLAANTTINTNICTLVAGHGVVAGNILCFKEGKNFMQAEVINVATDTITLDMPFDFGFTTAALVDRSTNNMAVDGSVTPQIFRVTPVGTTNKFHITRLQFHIEDDTIMDTSKFGGIPSLAKGIVVRKKDGIYKNIFNAKSNGDFSHHCQSVRYEDKAPAGQYELTAYKIFNGMDNHGCVIEHDYALSDEIEVVIQDDLTGLTEFHCIVFGHVTID